MKKFLPFIVLLVPVVAKSAAWQPATAPLMTKWSKDVSPEKTLPEYPRPQMVRESWLNLNGLWDYALTPKDATAAPENFTGKILVPFPYESALSGVGQPSVPDQRLWYRRTFTIPKSWQGQRVLLHFGAVNWQSSVAVNGHQLGEHKGGYTAFDYDITDSLKVGENELVVSASNPLKVDVKDAQVTGKQRLHPHGIFYTGATGIWQTVWLEPVPAVHIAGLKITPDVDNNAVKLLVQADGDAAVKVTVIDAGKAIATMDGKANAELNLPIQNPHLWSPDDPHLYDLKVSLNGGADSVESYFGMRKISVAKDANGVNRIFLNGKFVFQRGVLDQGYWPDGVYTAPTDEALRSDLEMIRKLGFNLSRKHAKVESDRWYFWADKLGVLVWQDMPQMFGAIDPNNKAAGQQIDDATKEEFAKELKSEIAEFYNHPSIIVWTDFNEGWGQHDTEKIAALTKELDPTRLVNSASGWVDKGVGDIQDSHHYQTPWCNKPSGNRASVGGEFGGIGMSVPDHLWSKKSWGYEGVLTRQYDLDKKYQELLKEAYKLRDGQGMSAFVYTQLTDVEQEINGLMTYDRKVVKPDLQIASEATRGTFLPLPSDLSSTLPTVKVAPKVSRKVEPFSLADVRLLPGPFQHAQDLDRDYLLSLEPDRFLHNFRLNAGLEPKAPIYGGWESQGVAGHTLGHYLSALSMMFQSTADQRLKAKLDYCVDELALCQAKSPDGYVSAIPNGRAMFDGVKDGDPKATQRGWVPWYTMHKLFAGLRDAYLLTGNEKAKDVLIKLSDWALATTKNLTPGQWDVMLWQEQGGMNEALADVYSITGDAKYLELARKFSMRPLLNAMSEGRDILDGWHANTQIPKVIGFERIYELTDDPKYREAARFFWNTVVDNRTYVTGGNSDHEHFFNPARTSEHLSAETAENCNIYNMLKLTRDLYEVAPDETLVAYYERALFNQILSSQDPVKGGFNYLNSLNPGGFKVYSNPTTAFWCCVGTGMENHARYGNSIYFHNADALFVNLFIASQLKWAEKGVTLTQKTRFPDDDVSEFTVGIDKPTKFLLKLRQPNWTKNPTLIVNGEPQKVTSQPGGYETIEREWKSGDVVSWRLPMSLHAEALHNDPAHQAILFGPIVMSGAMGREGMDKISDYVDEQTKYSNFPAPEMPAFVSDADSLKFDAWSQYFTRVAGPSLAFTVHGLAQMTSGEQVEVKLIPFFRAQHMRYNVYWKVYTPQQWADVRAKVAAEQAHEREIAARTIDEFRPNEQQSEADHKLHGDHSRSGMASGKNWRDAFDGGYFAFDLKVTPDAPNELAVTYWGAESGNRIFDIVVDAQKIATETLLGKNGQRFFDVNYAVPAELTKGKSTVEVRFQAHPGAMAGGAFGVRMLRSEPTVSKR